MTLEVRACGLSDVGRSRRHNEDSFEIDAAAGLFVVADGMGGHGHGEVASRLAVEAVVRSVRESLEAEGPATGDWRSRERQLREKVLRAAFIEAQGSIMRATREDRSLTGMGTTAVCCLLGDDRVSVAHVGDSRVYKLRNDRLNLLTEDHTWVNEQVQAGVLAPDEARFHPLKSVVTRALGAENGNEVDLLDLQLQGGDLLLLCSDGLTTMLDDERIVEILRVGQSPEDTCRLLVHAANDEGGLDNITVVVIAVDSA